MKPKHRAVENPNGTWMIQRRLFGLLWVNWYHVQEEHTARNHLRRHTQRKVIYP